MITTHTVWTWCVWVDLHHELLLATIIISWVLHLLFSILLLLGAMLYNRALFLPWLVSDMIILILMVITFTCWTFMSFFVDLLVAIVFPVVVGLILGLWIFLWRGVQTTYRLLGHKMVQEGYRLVPRTGRPLPTIGETEQ